MRLNVVSSKKCPIHFIRMPMRLRRKLDLDIGDWLMFNTKQGNISLMVSQAAKEDEIEFGDFRAVVSDECIIIEEGDEEVNVKRHDLTIGADPEFFFVDTRSGIIVEGYTLFDKEGELGSDGDLGEMRPDFALSPDQVTQNLYDIIKTMPYRLPHKVKPIATSWYNGFCCGFHLHFGLPAEIITFAADKTNDFIKNIIHVMDYMVGIVAHSVDPDDNRRLSENYGIPGDFRLSMRTVEYRTPGGYHLRTREHANSLLCLGFSVMDALINDCEVTSAGWTDMSKVSTYEYFMDKFGIPEYDYVYKTMRSKNKDLLKLESEKVARLLLNLGSDYVNDIVLTPANNASLLEGWL